jgi:hypothetical protein
MSFYNFFNKRIKNWIEANWLFEKILSHEIQKDKNSYFKGIQDFDRKQYAVDKVLYKNLKREAGLAEIARQNKSLLKYAFHKYRMTELIFNIIFSSNEHDSNKNDLNSYLRHRIFAHLNSNSNFPKFKALIEQIEHYELICSLPSVQCRSKGNFSSISKIQIVNLGDIIGYTKDRNYLQNQKPNFSFEFYKGKTCYEINVRALKVGKSQYKLNDYGFFELKSLNATDQERIFKDAFYYDNSQNPRIPRINSVQLNAFFSMKHFRDLYCHNIASYTKKPRIYNPTSEDEKYIENPELILTSNYYDRYVDNVIALYADFLINPHL